MEFHYCENAAVPEIPYVQDVLFAMRLSDKQECYDFCVGNHATYILNVAMVMLKCVYPVLCMEPKYNEEEARKIIARIIVTLSPRGVTSINNRAYELAVKEMEGIREE